MKITLTFIGLFTFGSMVFADKPVGTNLMQLAGWNGQIVFTDAFKHVGTWVTGYASGETTYNLGWSIGGYVPLGINGYPLEIPYTGVGVSTPTILETNIFYGIGGKYPAGTYTLMYEGTGRILLSGDVGWKKYTSSGTYQLTVNPGQYGITIAILESNIADPVRNIRLILPGYESTYQTTTFYSTFLERLRGFKTIRFLNWGFIMFNTRATTVVNWNERITPNYYTQATSSGVAYEHQIQLCNEVDADAWICIPHLANDDFVTQCARLWRDNLEDGRKLYIEYSNETWNDSYSSELYCRTQGLLQNLDTDALTARDKFSVKRSLEIFKIFETEFGGSTRLQKIISAHASNIWVATRRMNAYTNPAINTSSMTVDILAIAPYLANLTNSIGNNGEIDTITVDEILNREEASITSSTYDVGIVNMIKNHLPFAKTYGLKLCAYEGGNYLAAHDTAYVDNTTLTDKFTAANRTERMYDIYIKMFSAWFLNGGGLLNHHTFCELPTKYGNFGLLEWIDQPISSAPKYRAVTYVLTSSATLPSNFTGTATSSTTITWSWNANPDAYYYYLYTSSATGIDNWFVQLSSNNTSWIHSGLSPNTTASIQIRTFNIFGDTSPISAISPISTKANPPINTYISNVGTTSVILNWSANGNPPHTRYMILVSTNNFTETFTTLKSQNDNFTDTSYQHQGLNYSTTYYYRVRTLNVDGDSTSWDAIVSTCTLPENIPPATITDLKTEPGIFDGEIKLTWTSPGDDGSTGNLTGLYLIKYATYPVTVTNFNTLTTNQPYSYIVNISTTNLVPLTKINQSITGLNPGTTFYFAIKTADEVSNYSEISISTGISGDNVPLAPNLIDVTPVTSTTINIIWSSPDLPNEINDYDKYWLFRATYAFNTRNDIGVLNISTVNWINGTTVYFDTDLTNTVTYYYRIILVDKGDQGNGLFSLVKESSYSTIGSTSPIVYIPPAPIGFTALNIGITSITWTWTDLALNETGFYLKFATSPTVPLYIVLVGTDVTTATEQNLTPNTSYSRCVSAYNSYGESKVSNSVTTYTQSNPPDSTSIITASSYSVTIRWSANSNPPGTRWGVLQSTDNFSTAAFTLTSFGTNYTSTTIVVADLSENTTYWFKVRAFNENGIATGFDKIVSTTILPASVISPVTKTYYIRGYIRDINNLGVNDVTVNLSGNISTTTKTNSTGFYTFVNLSTGNYDVTTATDSYYFIPSTINITGLNADLENRNFTAFTKSSTQGNLTVHYELVRSLDPTVNNTLSISNLNSELYRTELVIPANVLSTTTIFMLGKVTGFTDIPANLKLTGNIVEFRTLPAYESFNNNVTLKLPYEESVTNPYTLKTYSYTNTRWVEVPVDEIDTINKIIIVKTNHLSYYVLAYEIKFNLNDVRVYPNPYKSGLPFTGINFSNLTLNATIQIFNIAGELIRTLKSSYGQAVWDTKNEMGNSVISGIYIYHITSPNGKTKTGKLAVLR